MDSAVIQEIARIWVENEGDLKQFKFHFEDIKKAIEDIISENNFEDDVI
jgi:hypothetical protein